MVQSNTLSRREDHIPENDMDNKALHDTFEALQNTFAGVKRSSEASEGICRGSQIFVDLCGPSQMSVHIDARLGKVVMSRDGEGSEGGGPGPSQNG